MKFWQSFTLVEMGQHCDLAKIAEDVGFTGVTLGDHLVAPNASKTNSRHPRSHSDEKVPWRPWDPDAPFPDPWQVISIMANATTALEFMTCIYILPLRDVFSAAKAISTAAVIANNRVRLGVGVGWLKDEFILTGQNFENRGERTTEMQEIIARLLAGGMVEYHGEYYDFPPVQMSPVPNLPVPVYMAGDSGPAMRRAVRADGWMSGHDKVSMLPELLPRLKKKLVEAGRDKEPFEIIAVLQDNPDLDTCLRLQEMGVTAIHLTRWSTMEKPTSTLDYKRKRMEEFAENVMLKMK